MPFTVQDLIIDRPDPVTVSRDDSAQTALQLMIDGDYSQLPVVNREGIAEGMITSDSIIRALSHFDLTIKEMRVFHAMTSIVKYRPDDDLFGLLDDLKDVYAVAVVDKEDHVIGIVTSYDTTEYFRRRGEDIMLVEDIETMLKEYVLTAFLDKSGEVDRSTLDVAIEEITPSNSKLRGPFQQALHRYLQLCGDDKPQLNQQQVEEVFAQHLNPKQAPKPFELLTLNDYIELFLSKSRWERYKTIFDLDPKSCRKLLEAVRNTRNELAHFRAELTSQQREELRFCKEWLARHQSEVMETLSLPQDERVDTTPPDEVFQLKGSGKSRTLIEVVRMVKDWASRSEELPVQLVDEESSTESRYTPLAMYLESMPLDQDKVQLSFENVELIIGGELPKYARQHRSWWANDSSGHVQSQRWLEAGWRVSSVNMSEERVIFSRMKEREQAYIDFFSRLLSDLREREEMPVRVSSADGRSWLAIAGLAPEGEPQVSFVGCSFARRKRFRVELYIDQGTQEVNKEIFDEIYRHREEIENELEEKLSWERLDERRASRIALYHSGAITDSTDDLAELRDWAVSAIIKFYKVFRARIGQTLNTAESSVAQTGAIGS
jgi:CBS domain-containing protein